ncbi:hypothetical protein [Chryseobacterium koreense]|uniref:Multidrug transporter n=2 Tax=root TaxID=1 RepID=A0A0J7IW47_9FLAO|nr:hypothetical protein [Chryseobacterium koreense]KMQ70528.1 hypothetical protein ACM44_11395 [Chryseobacterium koreense CCUG 49689]MBB5334322.1 hypothetical protein [Chryseobacterium koreense]
MKKNILSAAFCLTLMASASMVATSCSRSNDDPTETPSNGINPADFKGSIKSGTTVTLDPSKTYTLTGKLLVESGATLIIPAGTVIKGAQGATYLIVDRGGKIQANGTAEKPIIFEGVAHGQSYWGGIVILGNAPTNRSASGTSTSELGDMIYGGTNKTDNSGSMKYVVIKDSGFKYNPEKEFNGLSLFGVGSGTSISYIAVIDGGDDGIEFFGGNVNVDHLLLLGNGDDSFDWTEGWQGNAEYVYAARKKEYLNNAEPGNRGIEADTQDTDANTTNGANGGVSNPTIKNFTLIGNLKGSESQGMKIRAGSNGIFDNVVISNFATGLDFETDRTYNWFLSGVKLNNINLLSVGTAVKAKASTAFPDANALAANLTANITFNSNATGAGSGTDLPAWAKGWSGLTSFTVADAGN